MKNNIMITGAANGIGLSTFKALNRSLFDNIILVDREAIYVEGSNVIALKCDISVNEDIDHLFNQLRQKNIRITHAVNCAGVPGTNKSFLDSSLEDFNRIINTNLKGTLFMLQRQIEDMHVTGHGKILNIASVLASCGMKGSSFYAASKAGIVALTKSLAIEFAEKNIHVNCISPGGVDTNLINDLKKRIGINTLGQIHPVKRIATPEEIAIYIKFIMENDTSFMTGSEIFIDGGYSAQ